MIKEKNIDEEINHIINEVIQNNTMLRSNHANDIQSRVEYLSDKLRDLKISTEINHDIRILVKELEFLKLICYLEKVKEYALNGEGYCAVLNDYIKALEPIEEKVPGMSLGIKDSKLNTEVIIYSGYTDSDRTYKIDKDTKFDVASITKMFTSLLILKMNEYGDYDINKSLKDYSDGEYDVGASIEELLKFKYEIITNGRIDEDISKEELQNRLRCLNILSTNTYFYSDIPYILVGTTLNEGYFKEMFNEELKLCNTTYHPLGGTTGGNYGRLQKVHDPKAQKLLKYDIYPASAGLYTTTEDLLKLFDQLDSGFLKEDSLKTLITPAYKGTVVLDSTGKPIIETKGGKKKYRNVNRGMGVYIAHPYGIEYTDVPDISSKNAFAASGFTGCYVSYDLDNHIATTILANPFSSKEPLLGINNLNNELKKAQYRYVYATRLLNAAGVKIKKKTIIRR